MGRVWTHAFWRGGPIGTEDGKDAAPLNQLAKTVRVPFLAPVTVLVVLVTLIGILPAKLVTISQVGAVTLLQPEAYVRSVFGPVMEQKRQQKEKATMHGPDTHGTDAHGTADTDANHGTSNAEGAN